MPWGSALGPGRSTSSARRRRQPGTAGRCPCVSAAVARRPLPAGRRGRSGRGGRGGRAGAVPGGQSREGLGLHPLRSPAGVRSGAAVSRRSPPAAPPGGREPSPTSGSPHVPPGLSTGKQWGLAFAGARSHGSSPGEIATPAPGGWARRRCPAGAQVTGEGGGPPVQLRRRRACAGSPFRQV